MFIAPWTFRTKKGKGSNIELLEGFAVLTFTAIVMRIELLALLLPLAYECWSKKLTYLKEMIIVGGIASIAGLCSFESSVLIDAHQTH
jgi:putative flippase GtrA